MLTRLSGRLHSMLAVAVVALPGLSTAQEWSVRSGAVARSEYSDNYFFTAENPESAFVASISPFVTAARRTESSEVAALLAVGANRTWGTNPNLDFVSGRVGLTGTMREERSSWRGRRRIFACAVPPKQHDNRGDHLHPGVHECRHGIGRLRAIRVDDRSGTRSSRGRLQQWLFQRPGSGCGSGQSGILGQRRRALRVLRANARFTGRGLHLLHQRHRADRLSDRQCSA